MQLRDSKQLQGGGGNNNNNTATSPWHDAAAKRGVSGLRSYSSRAVPLLEAGHGNPGPPAIRCRNGASAGGFVGASGVPAQGSPQRAVPGCGPLFNWLINSGGAVGARRGSPRRRAAGRCRLPPLYRLPGSPSHILGGGGLNEEALIATEKCPNNFFSG